jgi:hypothetical protein
MAVAAEAGQLLYDVRRVLREGDALFIVPPFGPLDRPSPGVHRLQARAREEGFRVRVLYASLMLAALIGEEAYHAICHAPRFGLLGERFFFSAAYGLPPFGMADPEEKRAFLDRAWRSAEEGGRVSVERLVALESYAQPWADAVARAVVQARPFRIVGCVSTFQQTAAAAAILNRVKGLRPEALTLLGGGNCEGERAQEILSLGAKIDYVFCGDGEVSFPRFLRSALGGDPPGARIVPGAPPPDHEPELTPAFTEFLEQRRYFLREERSPELVKV